MTNAEKGVSKVKKRLSPDERRIKKLENDVKNMKKQFRSFTEARKFAQTLKIRSQIDWVLGNFSTL